MMRMDMNIKVHIVDGPLPTAGVCSPVAAGAVICFEGVVRPIEDGRELMSLAYEAYEPMATRQLRQLAQELTVSHGLMAVLVEHSRGVVPVGQCSFRLRIASMHRKEALQVMDLFIDRMKRDVPIWKRPVYVQEAVEA